MVIIKSQDELFFDLFKKKAELNHSAVSTFKTLLESYPDLTELDDLKETMKTGDEIRKDIARALEHAFVTPFEPEDIHLLNIYLDKIIGYLYSAALRMHIYKVEETENFKGYSLKLVDIILAAVEHLIEGMDLLRNMKKTSAFINKMKELEKEGDELHREAIASLLNSSVCIVEVIKWKEVYEELEEAIDICEDTAIHIDKVIIRHS